MRGFRLKSVLFIVVVSSTMLACRFSLELPWNVAAPDVEISPEDISIAATRAAVAAATASSLADQAGQLAATAVLQGDNIVSTAVAGESLPGIGEAVAVAGSLQQKLASIVPDANGNFTLTITDADLAEYIASQGSAFTYGDTSIENVKINIIPQHVVVTGRLTNPVDLPLTAQLSPVVVDGQLHFTVIDASAGVFPVPSSLLAVLETGINAGLSQAFNHLPAGVTLLDVALGGGSMTFLGQMN